METKTPSTIWVPRSFVKLRRRRGPNCEEARVRATIVIEKATPATVMVEPAMVERTLRAPSGPPAQSQPAARAHLALMIESTCDHRCAAEDQAGARQRGRIVRRQSE